MAFASHMHLRSPSSSTIVSNKRKFFQTVFDWKLWEKAARDPKMTTYLNQGVKAKMCETTPFVSAVGAQYIAALAKIELACDSIQEQGATLSTCIGLADGVIHPASDCDNHIAKSLLTDVSKIWSTMVIRATPFSSDLFQHTHPHHQVLFSSKPHRPGSHQWRPAQTMLATSARTPSRRPGRVLPGWRVLSL